MNCSFTPPSSSLNHEPALLLISVSTNRSPANVTSAEPLGPINGVHCLQKVDSMSVHPVLKSKVCSVFLTIGEPKQKSAHPVASLYQGTTETAFRFLCQVHWPCRQASVQTLSSCPLRLLRGPFLRPRPAPLLPLVRCHCGTPGEKSSSKECRFAWDNVFAEPEANLCLSSFAKFDSKTG